jgi:cytochrome P450
MPKLCRLAISYIKISAVLHETLRITSPIVARSSAAIDDTVIVDGDKRYEIKKGTTCVVLFAGVHRDSEVYGDNVITFFFLVMQLLTIN